MDIYKTLEFYKFLIVYYIDYRSNCKLFSIEEWGDGR
jgi:hypothetical protein